LAHSVTSKFATQQLLIYPPHHVLLLHYLGKTVNCTLATKVTHYFCTMFLKNIQFVYTVEVNLSLNITANVQMAFFFIYTGLNSLMPYQ